MIRNVVFDMGNVLLSYNPMNACLRHAPGRAEAEAVMNALFLAPEWEGKLDGCLITEAEMLSIARSRLPTEALRSLCARVFEDYHEFAVTPVAGMEAVVRLLHGRGFGIYLLSNVGERFGLFKHRIPGVAFFDGFVLSGEEKITKPDPEIFRRLCARFGLAAGECLFVDDRQGNVDAANAFGMTGYLFASEDAAGLAAFLEGLPEPG